MVCLVLGPMRLPRPLSVTTASAIPWQVTAWLHHSASPPYHLPSKYLCAPVLTPDSTLPLCSTKLQPSPPLPPPSCAHRYGLLNETQDKLDYVLALSPQDFMERRLQTLVFKQGLAKSIHHARVLIRQRHIRVGKQVRGGCGCGCGEGCVCVGGGVFGVVGVGEQVRVWLRCVWVSCSVGW